uniref:Uncharacterized protein n=1 Tax=Megaviridae environmental sample TaxID=1737588 RepID=A0A5J6VJE1_9VIRU|nr:MAG: hypothetical protein [Megaviridae environmental sample]
MDKIKNMIQEKITKLEVEKNILIIKEEELEQELERGRIMVNNIKSYLETNLNTKFFKNIELDTDTPNIKGFDTSQDFKNNEYIFIEYNLSNLPFTLKNHIKKIFSINSLSLGKNCKGFYIQWNETNQNAGLYFDKGYDKKWPPNNNDFQDLSNGNPSKLLWTVTESFDNKKEQFSITSTSVSSTESVLTESVLDKIKSTWKLDFISTKKTIYYLKLPKLSKKAIVRVDKQEIIYTTGNEYINLGEFNIGKSLIEIELFEKILESQTPNIYIAVKSGFKNINEDISVLIANQISDKPFVTSYIKQDD